MMESPIDKKREEQNIFRQDQDFQGMNKISQKQDKQDFFINDQNVFIQDQDFTMQDQDFKVSTNMNKIF